MGHKGPFKLQDTYRIIQTAWGLKDNQNCRILKGSSWDLKDH